MERTTMHAAGIKIRGFKSLFVFLVLTVSWLGCDRNVISPVEEFAVQGTMTVSTVDLSGNPVQAPVSFKISREGTSGTVQETFPEVSTVYSDFDGHATLSRTFHLKSGESFSIIADVSSETHESLTYWTAYFRSTDAPAKEVEVQLSVVSR